MKIMQTLLTLAQEMEAELTARFPELEEDRQRYLAAMEALKRTLGDGPVEAAMESVRRQTVSNLLFSAALGLTANLDHFRDSVARTFLEVDPAVFLREQTARRLPEYAAAQEILDRFYAALPAGREAEREAIAAYISHMETLAPKLAHYQGYLLGDALLPRIVPGYHSDDMLTTAYTGMLEAYLGQSPA